MRIIPILISLFFIPRFSFSQDSLIKYYNRKVALYLDKEKALSPFYSIDKEGIKIYSSAQNKAKNIAEKHLTWKEITDKKETNLIINQSEKQRLKKLKIAIDPGHLASTFEMGVIESKFIQFKNDSANTIAFAEGMLTYATAFLLKTKLESEGAEVFLTRTSETSAFGKSYKQWLKDDLKNVVDSLFKAKKITATEKQYFLNSKTKEKDIFRLLFKDLELTKRSEIINEYKPDFTIIIHYNVDEKNTGWTKPGPKNFNMTFIGGAFMRQDLATPKKRLEFLRLLASDDLEKSIQLSTSVVNSFEKNLNVKTASANDATYLQEGCLSTESKGVFCRNLQLTRYIHSPLVYGETLYQDNINECKALNKETDKTQNERIQQVADAYFKGILEFVEKKKR